MLRSNLKLLLSLTVGVTIVIFLFSQSNIHEVLSLFLGADLFLLALACMINILILVVYSYSWYILVKTAKVNVDFFTCMRINLASLFLVATTPIGVLGEALRVFLLRQVSSNSASQITATVVLHRIIYTLGFGTLASISLFAVLANSIVPFTVVSPFMFFGVLSITIPIVGLFLIHSEKVRSGLQPFIRSILPFASRFYRFDVEATSLKIEESFSFFHETIRTLYGNKISWGLSYGLVVTHWTLYALINFIVFQSIGYEEISIWLIMLVMLLGEFVMSVPVAIPGMLGVMETVMTVSYVSLGVPLTIAIATTLLVRFIVYWLNVAITGIFAISTINLLKGIKQNSKETSSKN